MVRFCLEISSTADERVEGWLHREGTAREDPFSGWVHLLGLLESALALTPPPPVDDGLTSTDDAPPPTQRASGARA